MPDEALDLEQEGLKRGMGYWTVLALAIGSMMGTTLFFGAPLGAKHSGNMLLVAWIILSVMALYLAAIFSELVAMFPKSGGAYEYTKQAYGKFISFILPPISCCSFKKSTERRLLHRCCIGSFLLFLEQSYNLCRCTCNRRT